MLYDDKGRTSLIKFVPYRLAKEEVGHCTEQRDSVDQRTENDSQIADELNILDAADNAFDFRFDMSITGVTKIKVERLSTGRRARVSTYKTSTSIMI